MNRTEKAIGMGVALGLLLAGCKAVEGGVSQEDLDRDLTKPTVDEVDPTVEAMVEEMMATKMAESETVKPVNTPTAEASPTPYVVESPTPEPVINGGVLPLNPPEFKAAGGAFSEAIQAPAKEAYYRSLYEMYKLKHGPTYFYAGGGLTAQEVFEREMRVFAMDEGLQIFQSERPDGMGVVSFPVKNKGDGTWSMWWFATSGGAFSALPDIPSTTDSVWTEIGVDGRIGGAWGEDGNFYVFQLNEQTKAEAWFSPAESVVGSLMWREVVRAGSAIEQPAVSAELVELAARYPLMKDWRQAERCQIPWELVKEGIPGKIARLEGQPFPETAYNTGDIYLYDGDGYNNLTWGWAIDGRFPEDKDYRSNPETRPYRWVGYFGVVDENGHDYVGAVQQWLNPSRKISYLTYVVPREWVNSWVVMAVGWPLVDCPACNENWNGYSYLLEPVNDVKTQELLKVWQESGEIPEELEKVVLVGLAEASKFYLPITP